MCKEQWQWGKYFCSFGHFYPYYIIRNTNVKFGSVSFSIIWLVESASAWNLEEVKFESLIELALGKSSSGVEVDLELEWSSSGCREKQDVKFWMHISMMIIINWQQCNCHVTEISVKKVERLRVFLTINYRVVSFTVASPRAQFLTAKSREKGYLSIYWPAISFPPVTRSLRSGIVVVIRSGSIRELGRVWYSYKPPRKSLSGKLLTYRRGKRLSGLTDFCMFLTPLPGMGFDRIPWMLWHWQIQK